MSDWLIVVLSILAYSASFGAAIAVYRRLGAKPRDLWEPPGCLGVIFWPVVLAVFLIVLPGLILYWVVFARKEEAEKNRASNASRTPKVCPFCSEELPREE